MDFDSRKFGIFCCYTCKERRTYGRAKSIISVERNVREFLTHA